MADSMKRVDEIGCYGRNPATGDDSLLVGIAIVTTIKAGIESEKTDVATRFGVVKKTNDTEGAGVVSGVGKGEVKVEKANVINEAEVGVEVENCEGRNGVRKDDRNEIPNRDTVTPSPFIFEVNLLYRSVY